MSLRSLLSRLDRLAWQGTRNSQGGHLGMTVSIAGLPSKEFFDCIEGAIREEDHDVWKRLIDVMRLMAKQPRKHPSTGEIDADDKGQPLFEISMLRYWLHHLRAGHLRLPKSIPRLVLESLDSEHGCVLFRCESCLTGYGNAIPSAVRPCAVCGSAEVCCRKLSISLLEWEPVMVQGKPYRVKQ
jgi:hypothetical protein